MVVAKNLQALNAQRQLNIVGHQKGKTMEKLSSGFRVNRAADDAAGLSISEKMRRQIRGLTQASANAADGISLAQTAEGALNEVQDMLHRMNELSVKAANGTLSEQDRIFVDEEIQQLKSEINRVADTTKFNETTLFPPNGSQMYHANYGIQMKSDGTVTVELRSDAYTVGEVSATDNAKELSKYIAELIPETMNDLLDVYTSLKGADDLSIDLELSYIDGPHGTLAFASYQYYTGNYEPVKDSFMVKVDTADFTDSSAMPGKDRNGLLKSTLAHELTHSLMQYTLTESMQTDLPTWFKEGAAQMSGGGFSTGWLGGLAGLTQGLNSGDNAKDGDIQNYLKGNTVEKNPYGHGYLATAYASYLAAGKDVNKMGEGLNAILGELKDGKTLDEAIQQVTGNTKNKADIISDIQNGVADAVTFARELSIATGTGAGSSVYGLRKGTQLMGAVPTDGSNAGTLVNRRDVDTTKDYQKELSFQVGADAGQRIEVELFALDTRSLGIMNLNVRSEEKANEAIDAVSNALTVVSSIRSYYGAVQNRLEHTVKNLDNVVENTTSAESCIRDTDMAKEMVQFSMKNILEQAGQSMLAQANQSNQGVLSLLQ